MVKVTFTANLERHITCPPTDVRGSTVREVLEAVFQENPVARSYVLDDQQALRKHMLVFVDGIRVKDRTGLSDRVGEHAEVYVFQALSGGY